MRKCISRTATLMNGGVVEFAMSVSSNKKRGLKADDKPYLMTNGE